MAFMSWQAECMVLSPTCPLIAYDSIVYPPFRGESNWKNGLFRTSTFPSTISQWSALMICWLSLLTKPESMYLSPSPEYVATIITGAVLKCIFSSYLAENLTLVQESRLWGTIFLSTLPKVAGESSRSSWRIDLVVSSLRYQGTNQWTPYWYGIGLLGIWCW